MKRGAAQPKRAAKRICGGAVAPVAEPASDADTTSTTSDSSAGGSDSSAGGSDSSGSDSDS